MAGDMEPDARFSSLAHDPKYRSMPRKQRRTAVDRRFAGMFTEKRFQLKSSVDKRGRPVNLSAAEDLRQFYDKGEDGEDSDQDEEAEELESTCPTGVDEQRACEVEASEKSQFEQELEEEKPAKKSEDGDGSCGDNSGAEDAAPIADVKDDVMRRFLVDYARGGGGMVSSSSDDDSSDASDVEGGRHGEPEVEHAWAELDADADRIEDEERQVSERLALCNMDWDCVKAQDIMVLLSSFLPAGGVVQSVHVFPSEFGRQRMAEEDVEGPYELRAGRVSAKQDAAASSEESCDDGEVNEHTQTELIRRYQLTRLRYYYAIIVCDSPSTASALYEQCDGLEFESSASRLDLRFVPEDMEFDERVRDSCCAMPEAGKYRPPRFVTTALQQQRVRLTWDDTDADRQEVVRRAAVNAVNDDQLDPDICAYLASSSEDELQQDGEEAEGGRGEDDESEPEDEASSIAKYRALLQDIDRQESKGKETQMEISWGVEGTDSEKRSKKDKSQHVEPVSGNLEEKFDIESDISDSDECVIEDTAVRGGKAKRKKNAKQGKFVSVTGDSKDEEQLGLLTMDDEEREGHFNYDEIVKESSMSKKKRKKQLRRKKNQDDDSLPPSVKDDFLVDVGDSRFASLYDTALYNVDPSHPLYRKTDGMDRLVGEKQRRIQSGSAGRDGGGSAPQEVDGTEDQPASSEYSDSAAKIGMLVKKIQSRAKRRRSDL